MVSVVRYQEAARFPHDASAFTQGLCFWKGNLYESTGQYGVSELRRLDVRTGKVLQRVSIGAQYFGEGLAIVDGKAYILTWLNQRVFVYNLATFREERTMAYSGEGWGLTTDGSLLYMSNGTDQITVRNPADFAVTRTISVTMNGKPVTRLNELEWVEGEIWANVWQSDQIVRIDPEQGKVIGVIDLTGILPEQEKGPNTDVLNGIAFLKEQNMLLVTGKNWPLMFQLALPARP
jgi:glutamine cyclotransferase